MGYALIAVDEGIRIRSQWSINMCFIFMRKIHEKYTFSILAGQSGPF